VASGMTVSIAGLQDAATRLATAAARTVRSSAAPFTPEFSGRAAATIDSNPDPLMHRTADLVQFPEHSANLYTPSYAEDIVSMRLAVHAYKANVRMVRAQVEMDHELSAVIR
jgi:hypothetical protein